MKLKIFTMQLIFLSLFVISCDETINQPSDEYIIEKTVSTKTTSQIIESGTEFKMIFPANCLSGNLELKIKKENSIPFFNIPNTSLGSNAYRIKFSGNTSFSSSVKIIINYDKTKIPSGKTAAETVKGYIYSKGNWKLGDFVLDEVNFKIIFTVSNFATPKTLKDLPSLQEDGDIVIGSFTNTDSGQNDGIKIGNQFWTSKNIDVDCYRNGDPIPQITDASEWTNLTTGAWCYYNNDPVLGEIYGKLYNWYAVNDPRGLAPKGWHIPSDAEWVELRNFLGEKSSGGKLKESGTTHWKSPNEGATNEFGFTSLPGGSRVGNPDSKSSGLFFYLGETSCFFSSTSQDAPYVSYSNQEFDSDFMNTRSQTLKGFGMSVRCVKDK